MVILNKLGVQAQFGILVFPEEVEKEAALILNNFRCDNDQSVEMSLLD